MAVLIGMACGATMIALFVLGAVAGWMLRGKIAQPATPPSVAEKERKRVMEDHEAFQKMMSYSMNDAYQLGAELDGPGGETLK